MSTSEGWRSDIGTTTLHDVDSGHCVFDFSTDDSRPDRYRSSWGSHCFRESFQKRPKMPMMWNHADGYPLPIGSSVRAESLPHVALVVNKFADTATARDVHTLMLSNMVPGASFHFVRGVAQKHPTLHNHIRYVRADMLESSPVLNPSSAHNVIAGVRSMAMHLPAVGTGTIELEDIERMMRKLDRHASRREVMAILAERESGIRSDNRAQDERSSAAMAERVEEILARTRRR